MLAEPRGRALRRHRLAIHRDRRAYPRNVGDAWTIIADVPPVSKAGFYKGPAKDRIKLANVDDIVANPTATKRWQEATKAL